MKNLYKFSKSEAKRNGELKEYRESFNENIYCRDFLDDQLNQKFDGMHLSTECVETPYTFLPLAVGEQPKPPLARNSWFLGVRYSSFNTSARITSNFSL